MISITIARRVVNVLSEAGTNLYDFRAHLTKSVSSSKVSETVLSLEEQSKAAGWTNAKAFAAYCRKLCVGYIKSII